jgi:hypothetical protein
MDMKGGWVRWNGLWECMDAVLGCVGGCSVRGKARQTPGGCMNFKSSVCRNYWDVTLKRGDGTKNKDSERGGPSHWGIRTEDLIRWDTVPT